MFNRGCIKIWGYKWGYKYLHEFVFVCIYWVVGHDSTPLGTNKKGSPQKGGPFLLVGSLERFTVRLITPVAEFGQGAKGA